MIAPKETTPPPSIKYITKLMLHKSCHNKAFQRYVSQQTKNHGCDPYGQWPIQREQQQPVVVINVNVSNWWVGVFYLLNSVHCALSVYRSRSIKVITGTFHLSKCDSDTAFVSTVHRSRQHIFKYKKTTRLISSVTNHYQIVLHSLKIIISYIIIKPGDFHCLCRSPNLLKICRTV